MKKLMFVSTFLAFLISLNTSFSQPKLIVHLTGGYSLPLSGLAGDPGDLFANFSQIHKIQDPKLYEKYGISFGGDIKYAFDKKGAIRGVLGFNYYMFSNKYDVTASQNFPSGITYKPQFKFFAFSIGAEYAFLTNKRISPFVGVDFTSNFYGGTAGQFLFIQEYDPNSEWESGSRQGVQFGAGVDIALNKSKTFGLVAGVKYHLINLIGKSNDINFDINKLALRDQKHTNTDEFGNDINVNVINLQSLNFYVGISFFLMQPKRQLGRM